MLKAIKYIALYEAVKLVGKSALVTYAQIVREKKGEGQKIKSNSATYLLSVLSGYHIGLANQFSPFKEEDFLDVVNKAVAYIKK